MKPQFGLFLVGLLLLSPGIAAPSTAAPARILTVSGIEQRNESVIRPGSTQFTVRRVLGEPRRRLDGNTWIYENYAACDWKVDTGNCSTLVVSFGNGTVTELQLVNEPGLRVIAASRQRAAAPAVATK